MANNKNNKNRYAGQRTTYRDEQVNGDARAELPKKIFYGLLTVILAAAIVFMGCFLGIPKFNTWVRAKFNSGITSPDPDNGTGIEDGVIVSDVESNGIKLTSRRLRAEEFEDYGIEAQAESAQVLTASFTPSNTTFQDVTWNLSGGEGKVILSRVAGNSLQATVSVTGVFSERATVTCTSDFQSGLSATASVDYLKKPTFYNLDDFFEEGLTVTHDIPTVDFFKGAEGTLSATKASGVLRIDFLNSGSLRQQGYDVKDYLYFGSGGGFESQGQEVDLINDTVSFSISDFFGSGVTEAQKSDIYSLLAWYADNDGMDLFEITYENVSFYYGDTRYYYYDGENGYLLTIGCRQWSDYITYGQSMNFEPSHVVFFPPEDW